MTKHSLRGSAATTTVLLVGAIATVIATLLLSQSTDNVISAKVIRDGKRAEYAVMACAEIAAKKARDDAAYVGSETITVTGAITCSIGARTISGTDYVFTVNSTVGDSTKTASIKMGNVGPPAITIKYWQEE